MKNSRKKLHRLILAPVSVVPEYKPSTFISEMSTLLRLVICFCYNWTAVLVCANSANEKSPYFIDNGKYISSSIIS